MFDEKQSTQKEKGLASLLKRPSFPFPKGKKGEGTEVVWFDESKKGKASSSRKKNAKSKKTPIARTVLDLFPIVDERDGIYQLRDEAGYFDIYQVTTKDVVSQNENDTDIDIFTFSKLLKANSEDMKVVGLTYPVDTGQQQAYHQRKLDRTTNPVHELFLQQKIDELAFLQEHRTNKEFFLFIYAETRQTLEDRVTAARNMASGSFPLQELSPTKKENLLYKLSNQNSKLAMR